jgi:hypothetical protein
LVGPSGAVARLGAFVLLVTLQASVRPSVRGHSRTLAQPRAAYSLATTMASRLVHSIRAWYSSHEQERVKGSYSGIAAPGLTLIALFLIVVGEWIGAAFVVPAAVLMSIQWFRSRR